LTSSSCYGALAQLLRARSQEQQVSHLAHYVQKSCDGGCDDGEKIRKARAALLRREAPRVQNQLA
jgi:hypothetical protein